MHRISPHRNHVAINIHAYRPGSQDRAIDIAFGQRTRDALLLVFFTSIGLSAKLSTLRSGGKPLVILCAVTVLALVAQNLSGSLLAGLWGAHPAYGVLAGSLSFVGGPGTAVAWARELESQGLAQAHVVAVGAAGLRRETREDDVGLKAPDDAHDVADEVRVSREDTV